MSGHFKYIILGGGLTAGYAAQELVKQGLGAGELCILSAEETLPYERPPLSKDFLAGNTSADDILINEREFYDEHGIDVQLGGRVISADLEAQKLFTAPATYTYEKLLISTGARPRKMSVPGDDLANIFYLRQVGQSQAIRRAAAAAEKAVVIGGSFIGMETTAVLQDSGVDVTMIFPEEHVWGAFFTPAMADFFEGYYRDRGVTILSGAKAKSFAGAGGVETVIADSGDRLPADLVICGIGVTPNSELFHNSPLTLTDDGYIPVDGYLETKVPGVYAAGDITQYPDVIFDRRLHIEHWDNAVAQGQHAARSMMGQPEIFTHVPYFFSDVFDLSYEFWGDTTGAAEILHRGDVAGGAFSTWWLAEDGRVLAAFVMNRPDEEREMAQKWIKARATFNEEWR